MRVGFIGDIHGNTDFLIWALKTLKDNGADWISGVGDIGFGFLGEGYLCDTLGLLGADATILGNHDKQQLDGSIDDKEWLDMFDRCCGHCPAQIKRGDVLELADKTLMGFGGAESIDKNTRREHFSWWSGESIREAQVSDVPIPPKVDIMLTHTVPYTALTRVLEQRYNIHMYNIPGVPFQQSEKMLDVLWYRMLAENIYPTVWVAGHWHKRMDFTLNNTRFYVLDRDGTGVNALLLLDTDTMLPVDIK